MQWEILSWSCRYCLWIYTPKSNSRRFKRQQKYTKTIKQTKRQVESKNILIKTVSNKLCPASSKNNPPDSQVEEAVFSSSTVSSPSSQKWSALVHHHHHHHYRQVSLLLLFNPFYGFLLRLDRLAPPAGERLEWRFIPNQIRGGGGASGSTEGVKIGKWLGID